MFMGDHVTYISAYLIHVITFNIGSNTDNVTGNYLSFIIIHCKTKSFLPGVVTFLPFTLKASHFRDCHVFLCLT